MGAEAKQEQPKAEVKPKAKTEEKPAEKKREEPKPPSPFVLYVDLHCAGCAKKIEKSVLKIRGVEGVLVDMGQNQVTIKGIVEPQAVCNKIMKRTKRRAKVLSPLPAAEGETMPEVVTSQVSGPTIVELDVNMHCEACAEQIKRKILQMRGVQTAVTELSRGKVTVTGTMDADRLVEYVYRRTKKQARIVPQPEPEPPKPEEGKGAEKPAEEAKTGEKKEKNAEKEEEEKPAEHAKKEEGDKSENGNENKENEDNKKQGGGGENIIIYNNNNKEDENRKRMMYHYEPLYVIERIPPPQLFSDENPNACCIS